MRMGETHYAAKKVGMTEEKVREIRTKHATVCELCGRPPILKELAAQYGVSSVTIFKIVNRRTWKHIK